MSHGHYQLEPDVNNLSWLTVVVRPATASLVGGVLQGAGTAIDVNGVLSLAPATASAIGGVKIGANMSVASDGTISVPASAAFQTPWLSNINGAGFSLSNVPTVQGNGNITVAAGGAGNLILQTNAKTRISVASDGSVYVSGRDSDAGTALWLSSGSVTNYLFSAGDGSNLYVNSQGALGAFSGNKLRLLIDSAGHASIAVPDDMTKPAFLAAGTCSVQRGSPLGSLPAGTWAQSVGNYMNASAENGFIVVNEWLTPTSTIFEVGSINASGGVYTSRFKIDGGGGVSIGALPSASPGAGSRQLWYDPADSNRVKFAA